MARALRGAHGEDLQRHVFPQLERLLSSSVVAWYEVGAAGAGMRLERFENRGLSAAASDQLPGVIEQTPVRWGFFDPLNPEPAQRNRALTRAQARRLSRGGAEPETLVAWYERAGLRDHDQCRVLVCEGDRLLAWVGAFRDRRFGARERRQLQALVPALRDHLSLRAHLGRARVSTALLDVALEAVAAPTFVLTPTGAVQHANASGRVALELDAELPSALSAASRVGGRVAGVTVSRIEEPGVPRYCVAVLSRGPADPGPRARAAAPRWGLTPREATVLELLACGSSNKGIAAALRCAPGTVEVHVSRLLSKAGAETRAQLIADFWRCAP